MRQEGVCARTPAEPAAVKKIAILPTMMTLGNGVCGFAAIVSASKIGGTDPAADAYHFALSGWLILGAMVFDALDGYVARLSKSASKFGGELDSLCDAISFGVAPAFLLLRLGPTWEPRFLNQVVGGIAALYMVCAVLRLARFNVENTTDAASHKRFRGLPSPAAAGCLAALAIVRAELPARLAEQTWATVQPEMVVRWIETFAPLGTLAVALLMVSRIPYPHFTNHLLRGRRHFGHLIQVILLAFLILAARDLALLLMFWGYALLLPVRFFVLRQLKRAGYAVPSLDDVLPR
jgi:CDP-diacylglycerol---serine O-phosphatidyltransferase